MSDVDVVEREAVLAALDDASCFGDQGEPCRCCEDAVAAVRALPAAPPAWRDEANEAATNEKVNAAVLALSEAIAEAVSPSIIECQAELLANLHHAQPAPSAASRGVDYSGARSAFHENRDRWHAKHISDGKFVELIVDAALGGARRQRFGEKAVEAAANESLSRGYMIEVGDLRAVLAAAEEAEG
jgi:hypothetical protein